MGWLGSTILGNPHIIYKIHLHWVGRTVYCSKLILGIKDIDGILHTLVIQCLLLQVAVHAPATLVADWILVGHFNPLVRQMIQMDSLHATKGKKKHIFDTAKYSKPL